MASNLKTFDTTGGVSIDTTTIVDQSKNVKNVNSLEIKNSNFSNARTTNYVLTGQDTSILSLDTVQGSISLRPSSLNFINTYVAAVNSTGDGLYTEKLESAVKCDASGVVTELSTMRTVIKDSIPSGEDWEVNLYTGGAAYAFSYSTTKSGIGSVLKWFASVQIVSIDWT